MAYSIMQNNYASRAAYLIAVSEAKKKNPVHANISGGVKFFTSQEEKRIWKKQK